MGVDISADAETLHRAFRRLSKDLHPDTTALPLKDAAKQFQQLCSVYETLSDPLLRKAYDASLEQNAASRKPVEAEQLSLTKMSTISGAKRLELRRPLSGGELFALILLGLALFISLLIQ